MDEETDTAAGPRRRRNRLPRNRQRERVLRIVREHGGAIDAVELASRMKLHVTTVRFHLDALCDEGAIERTRMNRDGRGRPRTGYRAVAERLDYRILAEILAMELGETAETRARRAQRAGVQWAERIAAAQPEAVGGQEGTDAAQAGDPLDRGAVLATEVFDRMGFDAELAAESEPSASLSADSEQSARAGAGHSLTRLPGTGFGPSPPRGGLRPTPRGCCRAWSTTPRPAVDMQTTKTRPCRPGSSRSSNPNCVSPGWLPREEPAD